MKQVPDGPIRRQVLSRIPRFQARDGRKFGPLPREWAHFKGLYPYGDRLIMSYTVGSAPILETFGLDSLGNNPVFTRTLNIKPAGGLLKMRVARPGTAVCAEWGRS